MDREGLTAYGASWNDKREHRRMQREYEYLKRKFENQPEQV